MVGKPVSNENSTRAAAIAQAPARVLMSAWQELGLDPEFELLRGPETGLVSLRGRIGGGGAPFPFGDATATRASVKLSDGRVGHAMLMGRDGKRTTIAAVINALCHAPDDAALIDKKLITRLSASTKLRDDKRQAETAATRVDFFTMVRGED
ncbi:MAG: phosphonate C-P lyase system protein PhnG [Pseudomonadota bacterium]